MHNGTRLCDVLLNIGLKNDFQLIGVSAIYSPRINNSLDYVNRIFIYCCEFSSQSKQISLAQLLDIEKNEFSQ